MALGRSLFIALAIHAGVALAGRRWVPGPDVVLPPAPPASYEVNVVELAAEPRSERPEGRGATAADRRGSRIAIGKSWASVGAPTVLRGTAGDGVGIPEAAPIDDAVQDAASDPKRAVDLGLGRIWLTPSLPDRPRGEWQSGARAAGGLGQGLEDRDRARGFGRGGVVATLARSAAIAAGPQTGEGSFLVITDRGGRVVSVTLGESVGAGWADVARALQRALAAKRLRVPVGANGLSVRVQVRSKVQLPSGADPNSPARIRGPGAEFDVADLGARATRVVSAQITGERLL